MMQPWFADAKLGIFLHWGIYSTGKWGESWPIFNKEVTYDTYMAEAPHFTAAKYDPQAWAELFAASGAKYVRCANRQQVAVFGPDVPWRGSG